MKEKSLGVSYSKLRIRKCDIIKTTGIYENTVAVREFVGNLERNQLK